MILWLAILGAWTVSFLFAGIEAGLLSVDPVRLRSHVKQRTPGAARLNRLLKHPERSLVTVLIVTNLANILGLLLLTKLLVASFAYAGFLIAGAAALPIYLFVLSVPAEVAVSAGFHFARWPHSAEFWRAPRLFFGRFWKSAGELAACSFRVAPRTAGVSLRRGKN